jgi:hypothetical protein
MQNIDLYEGRHNSRRIPFPDRQDPEFYTRLASEATHDNDRMQKKASRLLFLITALCIISFTAGLVIGLRFAGGEKRELVDNNTRKAMSDIRNRVSGMVAKPDQAMPLKEDEKQKDEKKEEKKVSYPKEQYPFVISLGEKMDDATSRKLGRYLSSRGHTVILSKQREGYQIFVGPYKNEKSAKLSLKKIDSYSEIAHNLEPQIIKRI